jgi:hypothetical protein
MVFGAFDQGREICFNLIGHYGHSGVRGLPLTRHASFLGKSWNFFKKLSETPKNCQEYILCAGISHTKVSAKEIRITPVEIRHPWGDRAARF